MPKQHFVKTVFSFIIEVLGGLSNKLPFLSFSFVFFSFLTSQTPFEDDFTEDDFS